MNEEIKRDTDRRVCVFVVYTSEYEKLERDEEEKKCRKF